MRTRNLLTSATAAIVIEAIALGTSAAPAAADRIADVESGLRPDIAFSDDPTWTLEERMAHYGVPGVQIAVIDDFEVAWFKSYGLADREEARPVEATTLFQAGSVSKPVAAFGAMRMVADGRLSLDENVNDALTSWKLPDNDFTRERPVTLRHLLSHTGGTTVHGFLGYAPGLEVPSAIEVLDGSGPANSAPVRVDKLPGESFRYSGGGYTICQLMMTDVSGTSFVDLMHDLVIDPIGMSQSTYENPLPAHHLAHAAAGVLPDGTPVAGKRHTYPEMAAAGLWTTAEDLARFAIELQKAVRGESRLMSTEMAELVVTEVDAGYALGWSVSTRGDDRYFDHGGWDEGFCAQLTAHRDDGHGVAVMINSNHPQLIGEVVNAVAHTYGWGGYELRQRREIPRDILASAPGRYRYSGTEPVTVTVEDGRLFLTYLGGEPMELFHVGGGRYIRRERSAPIMFASGELSFVLPDSSLQSCPQLTDGERLPRELLLAGRHADALAGYRAALAATPDERTVSESYLNGEGYVALGAGRLAEAIATFRLNADLYPQSANVWDSLGEAYRAAGDLEQSLACYRTALDRDPEYSSAKQAVAELEAELR
jgi:CubicO group peptidase (beta-lactamase class C family)